MTAAEDETYVPEKAVSGLQGWIDCFEKQPAHSRVFKHESAGRNHFYRQIYGFAEWFL